MTPPYESILIPFAALSVSASLSVVLTLIVFQEMRSKFFMQIIAFISISDFIANFSYMLLYRPPTGNWFCTLQGYINFIFYPMSWLWTLSLVYHLYGVATTKALPSKWKIRATHAICWGLPILLSVIEIPFTRFVRSEPAGFEVCDITSHTSGIYHAVFYYFLLLGIIITLEIFSYKTAQLEKTQELGSFHPTYSTLKDSVRLYPTAMILCWLPHLILFITYLWINEDVTTYKNIYFCTSILKVSHGTVTACIFFYKSTSARRLWLRSLQDIGLVSLCCPCILSNMSNTRDSTSSFGDGENRITISLIDQKSSLFV